MPQALQDLHLITSVSATTCRDWRDFGVTLASPWHVLAINANTVRPRLSNGRALYERSSAQSQPEAQRRLGFGWGSGWGSGWGALDLSSSRTL